MGKGWRDLLAGVRWNHMHDLRGWVSAVYRWVSAVYRWVSAVYRWVSAVYKWVSAAYRRVAAICGRAAAIYKRSKRWLDPVLGIVAVFYTGWFVWQEVQGFTPSYLAAVSYFLVVFFFIVSVAWSYWREILVAVVGMVVGAIAGFVPYFVIAIFLFLLGLSPEGQSSYEELNKLFNNEVFNQLFFVAGAASGGPIAILVYFKRQKRGSAEGGEGR